MLLRRLCIKLIGTGQSRTLCLPLPEDRRVTTEYVKEVEKHWGDSVAKTTSNASLDSLPKAYVLPMFPYPSGNLHMGHIRVYTVSDCIARFFRLNQYHVIHPIGWDAFGLPAENAAIERKVEPKKWTQENVTSMKRQLKRLGCAFDWDREVSTCDPDYYKWTQLIFVKMFEAGLAYQSESEVNWDPVDRTVLADEQIDSEGRSWRSGAKIMKKPLRQWFIRTTQFSKELLEDLSTSRDWRDVAILQRNWLGKLDHFRFILPLKDLDDSVSILLKNPVDFCNLSLIFIKSSHILARRLPITAIHPFDKREIPVVINDQLCYGDNQDCMAAWTGISNEMDRHISASGCQLAPTNAVDKLTVESILKKAIELQAGGYKVSTKLRDWPISRQRFWGTPIPIVHCPKCKAQPVPESQLPVTLPDVNSLDIRTADEVASPLASMKDWVKTSCPKCGGSAQRETDTLDTFFDSSWYFLRYLDPNNKEVPFRKDEANKFMPVDVYVGGKEHALLHLFLARFVCHFLYQIGWLNVKEPFNKLLPQGMIMGKSYKSKQTGEYISASNVKQDGKKLVDLQGKEVLESWEKMSKSKHNGVDPTEVFDKFGTDITRLLITFVAAPHADRNWATDDLHLIGYRRVERFLSRICKLVGEFVKMSQSRTDSSSTVDATDKSVVELRNSFNYLCRYVTHHMSSSFLFHDGLKMLEDFINNLKHSPPGYVQNCEEFERSLMSLVIMIYPFTPHLSAEFWSHLQSAKIKRPERWRLERPVWEQKWPECDEDFSAAFLQYWVNDNFYGQVELDKTAVAQLDAAKALEMALDMKLLKNRLSRKDITNFRLHKLESFGAFIDIFTEDGVIGKPDRRKKPSKS